MLHIKSSFRDFCVIGKIKNSFSCIKTAANLMENFE